MSIIMPSGNNKLDWSPKGKMEKTASAGAVAEVDELLVAAKSVIKAQAIEICPENEATEPEHKDVTPAGGPADIKEALEAVEVAVEQVHQKVEEAEEVAGVVDEVEVEIGDVSDENKEIEIEIGDKPAVGGEDIIVESKPEEMTACAAKKDEKKDADKKDSGKKDSGKKASQEPEMAKSASTPEEFCKFAMISPENKKKLKDYWVNALGYPADFVNLMVKDYEK